MKIIKVNYSNNFNQISYWDDHLVAMSLRNLKLNVIICLFKKVIIICRHKLDRLRTDKSITSKLHQIQLKTILFYCYTNNL